MAINLLFGKLSKRRNSTKVFPDTDFTLQVTALLKEGTSEMSPSFFFEFSSNQFDYNYCKWGSHYYFVTDVIYERNNLFTVNCKMDVLATYKSDILATSAFVLYEVNGDTEIPDTRLSTKTTRGIAINTDTFNGIGSVDISNQIIVLGITSEEGVSYYAVTQTVASTILDNINNTVLDNLFPPISGSTTEDILTELGDNASIASQRFFSAGSAPSCITSAKELPVGMGAAHGNYNGNIKLGQFPTQKGGIEIDRRAYADIVTIPIPWTFSDWRRRAPYTELYLYCPYFGFVSLPTENLIDETSITIEAVLGLPTGQAVFEVYGTNSNHYIGTYSATLAGEYAVGVAGVNTTQSTTTMLGATAAGAAIVAAGGPAGAMAAKVGAAALAGIIGGNTPSASTISGGGGGASLGLRPDCYVIEITHDTTVLPSSVASVMGIPSMQVRTLSGINGFVQTLNASVSSNAHADVVNNINSLLDGGVFIE